MKLRSHNALPEETIRELEALAFRATRLGCDEVVDAACLCLAALKGNYSPNKKGSNET